MNDIPERTGAPRSHEAGPLLEMRSVDAAYGPYRALFDVSFTVNRRSIVALVGANGAGKSTVARDVSGLVHPSAGTVCFAGSDITGWPAWRIARLGLAHAPEGRAVFASLTVEENLELAVRAVRGRRERLDALERAFGAFPRLKAHYGQLAGTLSGGEQRMLALARVLVVPAQLVVVDELSMGLAPSVIDEVFAALRTLLQASTSLLVIEQHLDRVLGFADEVVVLSRGRVAHRGRVDELGDILSTLLGARAFELAHEGDAEPPSGESRRADGT